MDKLRITITGEFQKENDKSFTEEEKQKFTDDLIDFAEKRGLVFIGMTK